MKFLIIPVEGPVLWTDLPDGLETLQGIVGGNIEAVPLPRFIPGSDRATAYVNEEGKFDPDCKPNMRATDFMVPGIGLFPNDYIAGPFVVVGFNPWNGEHTDNLSDEIVARARLIEKEAA